jgi:3-oxoacyl-[acyl-carrier protein] reductase
MSAKPLVDLQGKRIIVTGAAQGIGFEIAKLAADLGGKVAIIDMNPERLAEAARYSDQMMPVQGNVAEAKFAEQAVQSIVGAWGGVDCLVNNAGISRPGMIEKLSYENWRQVVDVNLTGSFLFLQAVGRHLLERAKAGERQHGSIVNISSDAGKRGSIGQINYSASKAGLLGLTMSAAREWARYQIRVNTLCFGVVETPMTEVVRGEKFRDGILAQIPFGRWADAHEAASAACFLMSDAASYVTGQHWSVNGGYHIGA